MQDKKINLATATDIKHGFHVMMVGPGWQSGQFLSGNCQAGVHTRQARDLLSLPGTLGFKLAGRSRPAMKIPTPALIYLELRRRADHGQISRGRKKNPECQDMHALQRTQSRKSYSLPQVRLSRPEDEIQGEQVRLKLKYQISNRICSK